ncbi:DUF2243 domain-containing protein [Aquibium carbonis]|uniref:DUF2243 domain-containing protein n=1 Tax=Aquibium carbonis TaxID=2495581 RepID=A0A3S0AB18_9HYPH|nr:DUF2243 domain-containing protein [Aquibium carbonis]RST87709.1 DUF2243 domain-containing protein [Aquibium carbonis]
MVDNAQFSPQGLSSSYRWAGYTLGFSIGGFFDGILLHQVLQWHHLLAGLEGGRFDDLRFQILADGLFHVIMYVVGGVGLWLLWRSRGEFGLPKADRLLVANALVGFGAWHMLDGVASHWVLQIHWIKMDSDVPLVWDIFWFVVFGVAFVAWGWLLKPKGPTHGTKIPVAPAAVAALALLTGTGALFPPNRLNDAATVVVFAPGITPAQAMTATIEAGGKLIWSDKNDGVWAIELPDGADRMALYRGGALLVSDTLLPVGCLNWMEKPSNPGQEA